MHWADVMAQRLAERGDRHIVATGITPSGEFHIGHIREILTGDMIARAARHAGLEAELVFVVDNADPLRKVYPFLDASYERFIGHQLGAIPAPKADGTPDWERFNNEGWTYGDHFLAPFLDALAQLGVRPRLLPNLEAYRRGLLPPTPRRRATNLSGSVKSLNASPGGNYQKHGSHGSPSTTTVHSTG